MAFVVTAKMMAECLVITEAVGGLAQDFFHEVLFHKAVVVVDELTEHGVDVVPGQPGYHVAAAHAAESAPVTRSLVDDEHVFHVFPGLLGRPHSGKSAADDEHVGIQYPGSQFHALSSVTGRTVSRVRGSLSLKG